jgi:subfamily B ATP-binding cassette protein MsbA
VDGIDIEAITLESLRKNIALVTQEVVLFNDTIRNNIAYGALRNLSDQEVHRAAEAAHVMDYVRQMPLGLETMIGDNGVRLSGGQRQRLALARALLKDAPILILDEATSSLDTASERHIQEALETLRQGRTCIIIAHRLSTVENADRIIVLQHGRIVEVGSHRELVNRRGVYSELHRIQFAPAAEDTIPLAKAETG